MIVVDVNLRLRNYLIGQLPTWDIVASSNFMAPGYDPSAGTPGLAFKVRSGMPTEDNDHVDAAFQLKIYGTDPQDAWTNYLALDAVLGEPVDAYVQWAIPEGIGTPVVDPGSEHHFVMANYRIMIRNI